LRGTDPRLQVRVVPRLSFNRLGLVDSGELDAAVMLRPRFGVPTELLRRPLWKEPFLLAVPDRVTGRDWRSILQNQPSLRYDRTSFGGRLVAQFLQASNIKVTDAFELDEIGGLVKLVAHGAGAALVPRCRPYFPPAIWCARDHSGERLSRATEFSPPVVIQISPPG
jgi:DNA-binding transcriptional LysR family regulator